MSHPPTRNHLNPSITAALARFAMPASLGFLLGSLGLEAAVLAQAPGGLAGADKPYTVTVQPVKAQRGQPATARIVIKPAKGWHINKEFPASLKLRPPTGVVAKKTELNRQDAVLAEEEGRFEVVLTGAEAGQKTVPGDLRFAVCSETSCDPQRSPVSIEFNVQ